MDAQAELIPTPDGDILENEWWRGPALAQRVAILSHGLEGSSRGKYVIGLARVLRAAGWDVLARNFRGCGPGGMNRAFRLYHSGETDDLATVVAWAAERYECIVLAGFSAGGNQTLRYLGQVSDAVSPRVAAAVAFSVPCDLGSSSRRLETAENRIYLVRFMKRLREKIRAKEAQFPGKLELRGLDKMRTFWEFDDRFTAPMFGFGNAAGYYEQASSAPWLERIRVPTLLVNAADDPFLTPPCQPVDAALANPALFLEMPAHGGHVGFVGSDGYWSDHRALAWCEEVTGAPRWRGAANAAKAAG